MSSGIRLRSSLRARLQIPEQVNNLPPFSLRQLRTFTNGNTSSHRAHGASASTSGTSSVIGQEHMILRLTRHGCVAAHKLETANFRSFKDSDVRFLSARRHTVNLRVATECDLPHNAALKWA